MKKEKDAKKVTHWELEVDIDDGTYAKLKELGLELIKDDEKALVNYAAKKALEAYLKKAEKKS